jgi:hypothetical protein
MFHIYSNSIRKLGLYQARKGFIAFTNPNICTVHCKNYTKCIKIPCTQNVVTSDVKRSLTCITYRFTVKVEDVIHTISPCVEVDGSGSDFCLLAGIYSYRGLNYVHLQLHDVMNCISFSYSLCQPPSLHLILATLIATPIYSPNAMYNSAVILKFLTPL